MQRSDSDYRKYMKLAVESMKNSISEAKNDKRTPPVVGAVLVAPNGDIVTAYRGELSEGDHAEYTLLERKQLSVDLQGSVLFTTLEPCAPGARSDTKVCCAKRIVQRRIAEVWVGIEDPDPDVNGKGIQLLEDSGVAVNMFDSDFQQEITQANEVFIREAKDRVSRVESQPAPENPFTLEKPILNTTPEDDLSSEAVMEYMRKNGEFVFSFSSEGFIRVFTQLKFLANDDNAIRPTGLGLLLFGKNPQRFFPHTVIRATFLTPGGEEDIETFSGCLPKQAKDSLEWVRRKIERHIDRSGAERKEVYEYPVEVIRETVINALAHRSYNIEGASIHLEIRDDAIVVKSPGGPVKPISMERFKKLDVPYLSKNPRITYAFEKLGLSENRGLGFKTIRNLPVKYGFPLPTIVYDEPYLTFTFPRAYGIGDSDERSHALNTKEKIGLDYIRLNSPITRLAYEEHFEMNTKMAERHLTHFVSLGLIERIGSGPNTSYKIVL